MTGDNGSISLEDFRVVTRHAGLQLTEAELQRLLPRYQQLMEQVALLHDPELPLPGPAVNFSARWSA
jgi:hypothetical protein